MIDVETRGRRAGQAARTEAAERARHLEVPTVASRRRARVGRPVARPVGGALVGALVVLLVVLLVRPLGAPSIPVIDPAVPAPEVGEPVAVDGVLPVPPVGEVLAAYLEDGTPVFVSHPEDGEVRVVGALDPHIVAWLGNLVVYCPSSGWFEDLRHGSRFNAWGDYTGGPAPYALPDHEAVVSADGTTVRVTGEVDHTRPRTDHNARQPQQGPPCPDDADPSTVVAHHIPAEVPAIDGTAIPDDRWIWAEVRLGGGVGDPRACQRDGRCTADSPRLAVLPGWENPVPPEGRWVGLVRRTSDGVLAVLAASPQAYAGLPPAERTEPATTRPASAVPLLPLPAPGDVLPAWLDDGAPAFVAREPSGVVHVLDAASPDDAALVGWCPAADEFVGASGGRWTLSGEGVGDTAAHDLRSYPAEIVTSGETGAVRVTGDPGAATARSSPPADLARQGASCATDDLVRHLPGDRTPVSEEGMVGGRDARWVWVRMAVAEVDGRLLLCAVDGPETCGEPEQDPDPTNADCFDDIPPEGICPPEEDPVVVTPGAAPTGGIELLLVRGSEDGRTVEVRRPAGSSGP